MIRPALQLYKILPAIYVVVIRTVRHVDEFFRERFIKRIRKVIRDEPHSEHETGFLKTFFCFEDTSAQLLRIIYAGRAERHIHEMHRHAFFEFEMAYALDTHISVDDFPAELIYVSPHIK